MKRSKSVTTIAVASIELLCIISCAALRFPVASATKEKKVPAAEIVKPLETVSSAAPCPEICRATLSPYLRNSPHEDSHNFLRRALTLATKEANATFFLASKILNQFTSTIVRFALQDCVELVDVAKDHLDGSFSLIQRFGSKGLTRDQAGDVQTWLSASISNMGHCYDGILGKSYSNSVGRLLSSVHKAKLLASDSLCMLEVVSSVSGASDKLRLRSDNDGFPSWMTTTDRRLLKASSKDVKPDVVVDANGAGNFKTITEAINSVPNYSQKRYVIKVRKGVYKEYVKVGKEKTNIMLVGDGMEATVVAGDKREPSDFSNFQSATFAASGKGFVAKDIGFVNTAGPKGGRGLALQVSSDQSVFFRCKMEGYQDTLLADTCRQFYRECFIKGTVDFIFGNAAAVFQTCTLLVRGKSNVITAQARKDSCQNTGFSLQNCTVTVDTEVVRDKNSVKAFLGRSWGMYSRTVFMESYLDSIIEPAGWEKMSEDFQSTVYYGEYKNYGPGSGTQNRVKWKGYHAIKSPDVAKNFTVAQFIQGNSWLKSTGVPYLPGLTEN